MKKLVEGEEAESAAGLLLSPFSLGQHALRVLSPSCRAAMAKQAAAKGRTLQTKVGCLSPDHLVWTICEYFRSISFRKIIPGFCLLCYHPLYIWSVMTAEVVSVWTQNSGQEAGCSLILLETVLVKSRTQHTSLVKSFCVTIIFPVLWFVATSNAPKL